MVEGDRRGGGKKIQEVSVVKKTIILALAVVLALISVCLIGCVERTTVSVTFHANYEGGSEYTVKADKGSKVSEPLTPLREGYEFKGWYKEAETTEPYDFTETVESNLDLYAKWEEVPVVSNEYVVTFSAGYEGGSEYAVTVQAGERVEMPLEPNREGYAFVGWYKGEEKYDFSEAVESDILLTARWEVYTNVAVVRFEGEGVPYESENIVKNEKVHEPYVAKIGYRPVWYLGNEEYDFDLPVTEDITLTLVWIAESHTVTVYNYDGSKLYEGEVEYGADFDDTVVEVPAHPYANWYTFAGWDKPITNITEDTEITAVYDYNSIPEEAFTFELLEDGTYGIRLVSNKKDYTYLNLTGYVGFPEEYKGVPVTRILNSGVYTYYADSLFSKTENVLVPSSYKIIDGEAFHICLKNLTLAEGVEEVWACAFSNLSGPYYGSSSEVTVYLPSTLKYIEVLALGDTNANFVLTDGEVYTYREDLKEIRTDNGRTLVWKSRVDLVDLVISADITALYPNLFCDIDSLQSVVIEGSIKEIPACSFSGCYSLMSVDLGRGVEKIWGPEQKEYYQSIIKADVDLPLSDGNFKWSSSLQMELPSTLTYIGNFTFEGCTAFLSNPIYIPAGVTYIGEGAFVVTYNSPIPSITVDPMNKYYYSVNDCCLIEKGTGLNGGDTFMNYASMNLQSEFTVPDGVTSFAPYAFSGAHKLRKLTIPEGVEVLPTCFLDSYENMEQEQNEDGVWEIVSVDGLKELVLPSTLREIRSGFEGGMYGGTMMMATYPAITAYALEKITFPNGNNIQVYSESSMIVGNYLEEFTFSAAAESIGRLVISGTNIRYAVEEGNPYYVAIDGALYEKLGGNRLKMIAFPNSPSVTVFDPSDLGEYTLREIGENVCGGNYNLRKIVIPEGVSVIAKEAFYNCRFVTEVTISSTVREIGAMAFTECVALESITFNGIVPPSMVRYWGHAPFDFEDWDTGYIGLPLNAVIYVPEGCYYDYYEEFYNLGFSTYYPALDTSGVETYNYIFVENGGIEVEDYSGVVFITAPPYIEREGFNLLGWYTKDGTDGDWGVRVDFYSAYLGEPDAEGNIYLYARWSDTEVFEDGSLFEFAYNMEVGVTRTITLANTGIGTWFFKFTATETGLYNLSFDEEFFTEYSVQCLKMIDASQRLVEVRYYIEEETTNVSGFYAEAGETLYFYASFSGDVYNDDYTQIIETKDIFIPLEFTAEYLSVYTGEKWWEDESMYG